MQKRNKRYAVVGIYEGYAHRRSSPTFETGCFGDRPEKDVIAQGLNDSGLTIIKSPYCLAPAMMAWGNGEAGLGLTYLFTQAAYEWSDTQQGRDSVSFHSLLDIYAEIVMHNKRLFWMELALTHMLRDYDLIVYYNDSKHSKEAKKYNAVLRKVMKILLSMRVSKVVEATSAEDIAAKINEFHSNGCLNEPYIEDADTNTKAPTQMDGVEAQPASGDSEASPEQD